MIASGHADVQSFLFSAGLIVATPWLGGPQRAARARCAGLLEREQRQRERVAVGEERARIARELHDVVAHSVGGDGRRRRRARQRMLDRDPERAREALETIERTGRRRRSTRCAARSACCAGPTTDAPLAPQPGMDGPRRPGRAGARAAG